MSDKCQICEQRKSLHIGKASSNLGLSNPQKIFHRVVQTYIRDQARKMVELLEDTDVKTTFEKELKEFQTMLGEYTFHDGRTVSVDCVLYDVLNYGYAEFGTFSDLKSLIDKELKEHGYYMENENYCDWIFVRN